MKGKIFKLGFALNLKTSLFFLSPTFEHGYTQHISGVSKCNAIEQYERACFTFKSIWFKSFTNI